MYRLSFSRLRRSISFTQWASVLLLALAASLPAHAQTSETWQQEVAYEIDVTLDTDRHRINGHQHLVYTNNSPDTLRTVYYHLYFNAFHPQSMMAERNRELPDPDGRIVPRIFDLGPEEVGYHEIESLTQDGQPVDYRITDTVMRVELAEPILPGASTVFEMNFRSQVPLQTRRSGRDNREGIDYSMTQWYPKMAEYDKRGWHADPYVGREFYAPYGSFDVEITLPARYTVGATGTLQNAEDIGHGYDRRGSGRWHPDEASYADADSLTWHFQADDVHDFAWAADPDYIHEWIEDENGQTYHLLYEPDVEERWAPMSDWVPAMMQFFSKQYGDYAYPQFTVAQGGDGGMEYPMITLITGERSPGSLLGVTAHEAAHEWFYGMLGSNEADYAWFDEGFTSYATSEVTAHLQGRPASHQGAHLSVINLQRLGLLERFSTPADWFTTNAAYGTAAYSGGEMVVDMLGYVIGEEERDEWLLELYRHYRFRHPDPFDLEKTAEDVSGLRLDWYFEQFTNTTRTLDYAIKGLSADRTEGGWSATVRLERKDEVVLPVDLRLTLADGSEEWVNIPLGIMQGHKPVPEGWTVAEPWLWTSPTYTLRLDDLPARPVDAEIDPEGKTPDKNRLNNTTGLPLEARFLQPPGQDWFTYRLGYRPLVQYAHDFGFGAGAQARGQYLFGQHRLQATLKLWPQVLFSGGEAPDLGHLDEDAADVSFFDGIDYALTYATNVRAFGPRATLEVSAEKHLGFLENTLSLSKPLSSVLADYDVQLSAALVHQLNSTDRVFGVFERTFKLPVVCLDAIGPCPSPIVGSEHVNPFRREHMLSGRLRFAVEEGADRLAFMAEVGSSIKGGQGSSLGPNSTGQQAATRFLLEATKAAGLGPFEGRASLAFGLGAEHLALHKQFRLGAASFEERWRHDAFRSVAAAFAHPLADAHLAAFEGTGPVAYLLGAENIDAPVGGTPVGRNLLAGRLTLSARPFARSGWLRPFRLEAFSGVGEAWSDGRFLAGFAADDLVADAGLGVRYDASTVPALGRWTAQSDVLSGLKLVARFPFWASDPAHIAPDEDAFAFRWLIGISISE